MLRLTFTDEKKQVKILGESEDVNELYHALFQHARRLFIHPTITPPGPMEPASMYVLGQTKNGCSYVLENLDKTATCACCDAY